MPNRILKETICVSPTVAKLTWLQEVFFYRLIVNCDDFGRFYADPSILRGRLFPLSNVTDKQMKDSLEALSSAGIVVNYIVDGTPYLQIITWDKHQSRRAKRSKYPGIDESDTITPPDSTCNQLKSSASKCKQVQANVPEESRNRGIEESRNRVCTEQSSDYSMPEEIFIELPLNNKTMFAVTKAKVREYQELYPSVDIEQRLRNMLGWLNANKTKRKTKNGIEKFINSWLARDQDNPKGFKSQKNYNKSSGNFEQRIYSDEELNGHYQYAYLGDESETQHEKK